MSELDLQDYLEVLSDEDLDVDIQQNNPLYDDKALILSVQAFDLLYNKQNALSKNEDFKDMAWKQIAKETKKSQQECIGRWELIRKKYMKERYNLDSKWPLLEYLHFLKNHIKALKPMTDASLFQHTIQPSTSSSKKVFALNVDKQTPLSTQRTALINKGISFIKKGLAGLDESNFNALQKQILGKILKIEKK